MNDDQPNYGNRPVENDGFIQFLIGLFTQKTGIDQKPGEPMRPAPSALPATKNLKINRQEQNRPNTVILSGNIKITGFNLKILRFLGMLTQFSTTSSAQKSFSLAPTTSQASSTTNGSATSASDQNTSRHNALIGWSAFISLLPLIIGGSSIALTSPFQALTASVVTGLALTPFIGWFFYSQRKNIYRFKEACDVYNMGKFGRARQSVAGLLILLVAGFYTFGIGAIFSINQYFDHSLSQTKEFSIVGREFRTNKNSVSYFAVIYPPDTPFAALHFPTENIRISRAEYDALIPNQTIITLDLHNGFFGWPWYENHYTLSRTMPAVLTRRDAAAPAVDTADIMAACEWQSRFDMAQQIPPIPPQGFNRDYWPNGALRSEEPLVNGKIHGLARYWFANGRPYAEIPWKNGLKHGYFTLYREDGSVEQKLSYKDGVVYGINEWYKADGTLSLAWLYITDNKYLPVSACDTAYRKHL